MGRIRTIKPELFMDEDLGALSGDHMVLFIGLLTLADRAGLLENRPARIKAALFPYRNVDVPALLSDLDDINKVVLYADDTGLDLVAIPGFVKHQRPHPKEQASSLVKPDVELLCRGKKRQAVKGRITIPSSPVGREGKGREGDLGREGEEAPAAASAPKLPAPPPAQRPPDPFASGSAFFAWAQCERIDAGFVTERPPPLPALGSWFAEFMRELSGDEGRVKATLKAFAVDPYWRAQNAPFAGFMKQWRNYVPRRVA